MAFFANHGRNVFNPTRLDQTSIQIMTTHGQGPPAYNAPFGNQHVDVSHSWPDFAAASQVVASANQASMAQQQIQVQQQSQAPGYHSNMPFLDPALVTANHHHDDFQGTLGGTSCPGSDEIQESSNDRQGHEFIRVHPSWNQPKYGTSWYGHGLASSPAGAITGTNRILQPTGYVHPALEDLQHQHLQTLFGDQDHGETGDEIHENADDNEDQDAAADEDESSEDNAVQPGMVRTAAGTIRTRGYNIDFLGAPDVIFNMYWSINGAVEDIFFFPNHGQWALLMFRLLSNGWTVDEIGYVQLDARDELFLPDGTLDQVKWERCRNKLKYQANAAGRAVLPAFPDWTPNRYPAQRSTYLRLTVSTGCMQYRSTSSRATSCASR
ncbi:hypothetical protein LTR22_022609 [Elasticomyces elasticus]|nr:hypothetical protein LTR22_022609 [Elasticomyces elasticus]KAK4911673.1 hypothetical protein LTR49_019752 [Elasticomyces elasticus]